jgi:hypothetical protein
LLGIFYYNEVIRRSSYKIYGGIVIEMDNCADVVLFYANVGAVSLSSTSVFLSCYYFCCALSFLIRDT